MENTNTRKLKPGDKYLSIMILGSIKVAAFKNHKKEKPTDPDYLGNGIAVWINEKQLPKEDKTNSL